MKAIQLLKQAVNILNEHNVEDSENDAWLLFSDTFCVDRTWLYLHENDEISEKNADEFMEKIKKRSCHEPLQYITGKAYFMGLEFMVNCSVLIPRFDTEILVEKVLKHIKKGDSVLDMCTGSGCIGLSIAKLSEAKAVSLADISEDALQVAKHNQAKLKLNNINLIKSDMFANINEKYDIIVSNPPYIRSGDIPGLMSEVKDHEPMLALDGTENGLFFYDILAKESGNHLTPGGGIFMEIGCDQAEDVSRMLANNNFTDVTVLKDLAGLDRVACGWRK